MNELMMDIVHICPKCGLQVTGKDSISMLFGWRKSFRMTDDPHYKLIPQSWCIRCRARGKLV